MSIIVLIGANIAHSRSPYFHNTLFERYGLPYRYELMPLGTDAVLQMLEEMKRGGYRGANITSPHKEAVMAGLDELSDEARVIGAVNTIVFNEGRASGHNTDAEGFRRSLMTAMRPDTPFTAAVLGTGGAARAAIHVLLRMEGLRSLVIYSRSMQDATSTVERWSDGRLRGALLDDFQPADLVVHATPVGLAGDTGSLLVADQLRGTGLLYEMIYVPSETPLMREARKAGVRTLGGGGMFIGQALESFTLWTGLEVDPADVPGNLFG